MPTLTDPWNFNDAVRFASAWTGLQEDIVWVVMAAKERYLDLVGIGNPVMNEALLEEIVRFRHLLPDRPNYLDDRQIDYVVLTTGIDEETVMQVFVGETAYADHLGILTWPSEEERERSLGAPASRLVEIILGSQIDKEDESDQEWE